MTDSIAPPSAADPAPDWAAVVGDIVCPLCDYNLRGLTEPRCPECGYPFAWPDLLDPERRVHPYLFEEHPRRNISSFFRTFAGTFLPRTFWASLKPSHPPRLRRLALYWVLSSGAAAFVLVALFAAQLIHADSVARVYRQLYVRDELSFYPPPSGPARSYYLSRLNARASAAYPSSLSVDGAERILRGRGGEILEQTALIYLAWPFATFMTLMVFRASMRRAKVRPIHVTRCIIYGGNAALCTGVLASTLISLISDRFAIDSHRRAPPMMIVAAAVGIAAFFHLGCAYRRYLKFDRPWATAAASQVIVWLLFSVLAVSWVPVDEWVDIRPPKSLSTSDAASFVTIAYAAPIPNASARRGSYRSDEGLL